MFDLNNGQLGQERYRDLLNDASNNRLSRRFARRSK